MSYRVGKLEVNRHADTQTDRRKQQQYLEAKNWPLVKLQYVKFVSKYIELV